MSKRTHGGGGKQAIHDGVAVCIPWTKAMFKHAKVSLPSILYQEPEEMTICNIDDPLTSEVQSWFRDLEREYPKTRFRFVRNPNSTWADAFNLCARLGESKTLFLTFPNMVHLGMTIPTLVVGCADPRGDAIAVPNIVNVSLLFAASLPPFGIGNHRYLKYVQFYGDRETWSHHDLEDKLPMRHWCWCIRRELFVRIGMFKTTSLYPCASDEMTMSLRCNGVRIRGGNSVVLMTQVRGGGI